MAHTALDLRRTLMRHGWVYFEPREATVERETCSCI
jgi:hypothetical protein